MTPEQKQKLEEIANYCQKKSNEYRKTNLKLSDRWAGFAGRAGECKFASIGYERFVEFLNDLHDPDNGTEITKAIGLEIESIM